MSKITKKERVLDAMRGYGSISPWYAIKHLGDTRLAATIFTLKKDGHEITTTIKMVLIDLVIKFNMQNIRL